MAEVGTEPQDLLVAAFELVAERGWGGFNAALLGRRAGVPLVEVYRELPRRASLIWALSRRADQAMLEFDPAELEGLPPRDRVFELLMRRLDALTPFRDGLARIERDARRAPELVLVSGCRLDRSMAWVQEAAELRSHGLRARFARGLIAGAYLQTLRVWLTDRSADLARTMAELDKQLRRIEPFAGLREPRARPFEPPEPAPEPPPQPI